MTACSCVARISVKRDICALVRIGDRPTGLTACRNLKMSAVGEKLMAAAALASFTNGRDCRSLQTASPTRGG
jgi:hypothetical protein